MQEEQKHGDDDMDMEDQGDMDNQEDEGDMEGEVQDDEEEVQEEAQFDFEQMDLRICGDLSKYHHYF